MPEEIGKVIYVDAVTHQQLKIMAAESQVNIGDIVAELVGKAKREKK